MDLKYADLRCTRRFRLFIHALVLSTVCILIRSCFRVAELSEGLSGSLFNNQISFMILDGAMMIVAIGALVVLHPGFAFAGAWRDANFNLRIKKVRVTDNGMENK
ncbi:MAG: hypothetical protein M1827_002165 [Pycnora praestabilis]|nr:MAG: hypothetical protein M1827_002165 [Pycnora praestabilis]